MHLKPEGHVLGDVHVGVERVGLEDHGDVAVGGAHAVHRAALDGNIAGSDILEPRNHAQQRRLAAAGRADENEELALFHRDIRFVKNLDRAVGLGCVPDFEKAHVLIL